MSKEITVRVEDVLIEALKESANLLRFHDVGGCKKEFAQQFHDSCSVSIVEFKNYVLNVMANKLHFGEPVLLTINIVGAAAMAELNYGDWRSIQSELGDTLTEEWLNDVLS